MCVPALRPSQSHSNGSAAEPLRTDARALVAELVQANILKRRAVAAGCKAAKAEHVPLAQRQAKGKGKGKAARK